MQMELEARVGIGQGTSTSALILGGFVELNKETLSLLFEAFTRTPADNFAECDMKSLEQLFVMDTS